MNIDSKLWSVRAFNVSLAAITQRASGSTRYAQASTLPSVDVLAQISERRFDSIMREAFHNAAH